jgi:hypothetical protein
MVSHGIYNHRVDRECGIDERGRPTEAGYGLVIVGGFCIL